MQTLYLCSECSKNIKNLKNLESCKHPGCLRHISHPCEKCGRIGGKVMFNINEKVMIKSDNNCPITLWGKEGYIKNFYKDTNNVRLEMEDSSFVIIDEKYIEKIS